MLKIMEKHYFFLSYFFSFSAEPQKVVLAQVSLTVAIHEIIVGGEFLFSDSFLGVVIMNASFTNIYCDYQCTALENRHLFLFCCINPGR